MTRVTVEIGEGQNLPDVLSQFDKMGLNYQINEENDNEENEWGDLSEAEIESIEAGLADLEAGRVHTFEEVMTRIQKKLDNLQ